MYVYIERAIEIEIVCARQKQRERRIIFLIIIKSLGSGPPDGGHAGGGMNFQAQYIP